MTQRVPRANKPLLTPTGLRVLRLCCEGLCAEDAAARLGISKRTVQWHLRETYLRLEVHNLMQARNKAHELGLLD